MSRRAGTRADTLSAVTTEYTENVETGYFNCWTGQHELSAVRTLDLYMAWRDGHDLPPLASFPNLAAVVVPADHVDEDLLAELAASRVTSLSISPLDDSLAEEIFELPKLTSLSLSGGMLEGLPDFFDELPVLKHVDISNNVLERLPKTLLALPQLRTLDASGNPLGETPKLRDSKLRELDLSTTLFREPGVFDVARLPRTLQVLRTDTGPIVPAEIVELRALRTLVLSLPLAAMPDLRALEELEELELGGALGEAVFERVPASLRSLVCRGPERLGLTRIPSTIARLAQLDTLDLSQEPITELPAALAKIPLERLSLAATKLGDTASYKHLPKTLVKLDLINVGMTALPPRIFELEELRELSLSHNAIGALPAALGRLRKLEKLEVESCGLARLPDELAQLTQLRRLRARSNELTALPRGFAALPKLADVDLVHNRLPLAEILSLRRVPHFQGHAQRA